MKTLLILRHAKSSWRTPDMEDHDRPLKNRGDLDAARMGHLLSEKPLVPELILCSTALRARTTARILVENGGYSPDIVQLNPKLYLANPSTLLQLIHEVPDHLTNLLVVGHNPGMEELSEILTGAFEVFPTATLAQITFETDSWNQIKSKSGSLKNLWRPKEVFSE
ncbi:MAG TPA: histidine phosphatase family protein [Verrucomicrobiales bacterium]|nr:histidine phosphatase family protein [Verrucomicrobiales bacterium]HIL72216.1 histidine phosphatase family protein [Verrucomicrobiota bacterium]